MSLGLYRQAGPKFNLALSLDKTLLIKNEMISDMINDFHIHLETEKTMSKLYVSRM
jgi:hypothetical protein